MKLGWALSYDRRPDSDDECDSIQRALDKMIVDVNEKKIGIAVDINTVHGLPIRLRKERFSRDTDD